MKQKRLKNYLKLGILLSGISLFIISCQKDDDFKTIENNTLVNNSNYKTKRIYSKEIEQNKIIKNKINEIKEKQNVLKINAQNKTVYFSDYDFTINTNFAVYLENQDASYHSYTFKVLRDSTEFSLENLILSSNDNNSYDIYLSQYNLSQDDIALIQNNQSPDLTGKAILTKIIDEDFIGNIFSKETITVTTLCPTTTFIAGNDCGCDGHHTLAQILAGTYCACFAAGGVTLTADQTIFSWEECGIDISTGGGGTAGTSGGGGGGTANDSDPNTYDPTDPSIHGNNPVVSAPALEDSEDEELDLLISDCNVLSQLSQSPDFITKMNELKTATTGNIEISYLGITNSNGVTTFPQNLRDQGQPNSNEAPLKIPTSPINVMLHNHATLTTTPIVGNGSLPVQSPGDMNGIWQFYDNNYITNLDNFVSVVITPDQTVYALTINWPSDFQTNGEKFLKTIEAAEAFYHKKITQGKTNDLNETAFAEKLKELNIGITLYRGNFNQVQGDAPFTKWTRIKIKNDGTKKERNCN